MSGFISGSFPLWDWRNYNFNSMNYLTGTGTNGFSMNSMPVFTGFNSIPQTSFTGFQGFVPWSTGTDASSSSTGTNSSSSGSFSYETYKKQEEEKIEKQKAKEEEQKALKEIEKSKKALKEQSKKIMDVNNEHLAAIKSGTKTDGTAIVDREVIDGVPIKKDGTIDETARTEKKKKKGFWGKVGSWLSSAGTALVNIGKSIVGIDKDGKWDPLKCLKNIGITALAIGATFIPVVGPVIGYGLLAGGVISGAVGVAKGISKMNKAKTEEEEEAARQEICGGTIIGITSAAGLKGLGKSASAAAVSPTSSGVSAATRSMATARTGFWGKTIQNTSQFGRDVSVNAWRATGNAIKADKTLMAANGGGVSGFFKAGCSKAGNSLNTYWETKYNGKYNDIKTGLENKIAEIDTKLSGTATESERALLTQQRTMLNNNLKELNSLSGRMTKAQFDRLRGENSSGKNLEALSNYRQTDTGYRMGQYEYSPKQFEAFQGEMKTLQSQYNKDLRKLIKINEGKMRRYANHPQGHEFEVDHYTQANIRSSYHNKAQVKAKEESLTNLISKKSEAIAKLEEKLSSTGVGSSRYNKLKNQIDNLNKEKAGLEDELLTISSIRFKSLFKPETWRYNEARLFIGGRNDYTLSTLTSPKFTPVAATAQWTAVPTLPMFGELAELTTEEREAKIKELEERNAQLNAAIEEIDSIKTLEEWENYQQRLAAQAAAATGQQTEQQTGDENQEEQET